MTHHLDVWQAFAGAEEFAAANRWQEVRSVLTPFSEQLERVPRAMLLLAESHGRLHDPEPALRCAELATLLLQQAADAEGTMRAHNLLGIIHFETGALDRAHAHFGVALDKAERLGESRMSARITSNLGTICNLREEHEAATEHYRRALAICEALEDRVGESQALHNLGITYRDLGRYEEADDCFSRAARAAQAAGDARLLGLSVVARAELMLRSGKLDMAERMARMALLRFDVHASLFGLAEAHKVLGTVARLRGDTAGARKNLDQALELCTLHGGPLLEAETRLERGILLAALVERDGARADLEAAAALFDQLGAAAQAAQARERLAELIPDVVPAA